MAGLLDVTVNFVGGGSSSAIWAADCGSLCGEAHNTIGNGVWTLTETDDTGYITGITPDTSGNHPWTLSSTSTNVAISSVVLRTFGTMVFDRDLNSGGLEGTPGSSFGIDFNVNNIVDAGPGTPRTATVQYDNLVSVITGSTSCNPSNFNGGGHTPQTGCGDLWGTVTFSFTGGSQFITSSSTNPAIFAFYQDTDLATAPEPVTLGVTGFALLALVAFKRRHGRKLNPTV
jgi:hypothetical protein